MSVDPKGAQLINPNRKGFSPIESLNWYSYSANNPITYKDPTGNEIIFHGKESFNNFYMQDFGISDVPYYVGGSHSKSSEIGCFATAYSREANTWRAEADIRIGEPSEKRAQDTIMRDPKNFTGKNGDLILNSVRTGEFEMAMRQKPLAEEATLKNDGVKGMNKLLTTAALSDKKYTAIGTVAYGNGNHAFNILGYDPKMQTVTGFDTSRHSHHIESINIPDLTSVRMLTGADE